ncbi:uncharacterized protein CTRU02_208915 [Colletotrichum truncatum]|uniref:Uncharacterized protein n=1 Tax=Colletotrichum truncatum TaxID=5467 RepID=A0ACC3YXL6_COLTU|nr:uncharacterized protein CTRU02_07894 [Colletotrichum truncatum]KAF6790987.1 hypothetical protein CTRU02_07894 [Colletotrichum truncatum]
MLTLPHRLHLNKRTHSRTDGWLKYPCSYLLFSCHLVRSNNKAKS